MIQRAGIALGRLAYDADFSITRIDRDPNPTFLPPVGHKLVENDTVEGIVDTFKDLVGFDTKPKYNGFQISIPISASSEQRQAFSNANGCLSNDHFHAWGNNLASDPANYKDRANLLFIDLTPGQVASKLAQGLINGWGWGYQFRVEGYTHLGDVNSLDTHDVYNKLVRSIAPLGIKLHHVGILRPEGAFPDVNATDLEYKLPNVPVQWVTLDDLSRGAAVVMDREPTAPPVMICGTGAATFSSSPIEVTLANGKSVTILRENERLPARKIAYFTTSKDDQISVTFQLSQRTLYFEKRTLEGLTPRPKGQATIKVILIVQKYGGMTAILEEVGTNMRKPYNLKSIDILYQAYQIEGRDGPDMTFGKDGIIGELPE
ncbi:hypothetical protein CPB86DRAFT_791759 [Serendipita vermifera]|nr:hypothetical protein CPB86DRAFT_791759 [Serendipita vermifera]